MNNDQRPFITLTTLNSANKTPVHVQKQQYDNLTPNQIARYNNLLHNATTELLLSALKLTGSDHVSPPDLDYQNTPMSELRKMVEQVVDKFNDNISRSLQSSMACMRGAYESATLVPVAPDYLRPVLKTLINPQDRQPFSLYIDMNLGHHITHKMMASQNIVTEAATNIAIGTWDKSAHPNK